MEKTNDKNKLIGRKVTGFLCLRSEPYPWGEAECLPIFGPIEELPEKPVYPKKTIQERIDEAVEEVTQKQREALVKLKEK